MRLQWRRARNNTKTTMTYNTDLTNTLFQWKLAEQMAAKNRENADKFKREPSWYWLEKSKHHAITQTFLAVRLWRRFCRLVRAVDGFVLVGSDGLVYVSE